MEGINARIGLINNFIQLLINSGHRFQYIKSIVLQAISKYIHMVDRNSLQPTDKEYCPLHRSRSYKSKMRKLVKYTTQARWFTDERVGDLYKDSWKQWITRKGRQGRRRKITDNTSPKIPTTTVMFVPSTPNADLLKDLQATEENLSNLGWKTKLVEKPGEPLYTRFIKKIPMNLGCPRGDLCQICENKGTNCTTKGVVYKAVCQVCKSKGQSELGTYVGETSRQLGSRRMEHMTN